MYIKLVCSSLKFEVCLVFKDSVPGKLHSWVVYKFLCANWDSTNWWINWPTYLQRCLPAGQLAEGLIDCWWLDSRFYRRFFLTHCRTLTKTCGKRCLKPHQNCSMRYAQLLNSLTADLILSYLLSCLLSYFHAYGLSVIVHSNQLPTSLQWPPSLVPADSPYIHS